MASLLFSAERRKANEPINLEMREEHSKKPEREKDDAICKQAKKKRN